jgi:putative alpha-1,2-mannosidase
VGTWHNGAVTPGKAAEAGGSPARAPVIEANKKPVGTTGMVTPRSASVPPKDVTVSGPGSGGFVSFDAAAAKPVNVRIGLSFVSADGARGNLAAENNGTRTFDQVAAAARATWNSRLGEIAVTGGTDEQQRTFYSNLYHSLLQPNVFSDANGQYQGFDGRTHTAARGHAVYTNFSGWDIYRSESQLLALLAPAETADIVTSMIDFAQQGGSWDRWTVANGYTGVMNGDPYHIIVANAYAFGATGFDAPTALSLMVKGATQPTTPATGYVERPGLADYLKLGYVPGAAADTLEYTSADFAIAQLAQRLGDSATVDQFMPRAQNWQHLFNPATGYLEPRAADGSLPGTFSPGSSTGYVEGNGAQYSWMVPYNEGSLIAALGGNDAANTRLDTFFGELNAGTSRPFAFLSNEPSSETPWLYDYTGKPSRTQAIVRRVQNELFNSSPSGLQGNDDLGQLGSWYVWSALGLFPEIPGRAELLVGSPMFTSIKITTPAGHHFSITAPAASPTTQYVTGLTVDGRPSTRPWLPEDFARNGGTLDFALSSAPDPTWGSAAADAPPSFQQGQQAAFTFTDPARLVIPQDASDTGTVGTQDLTGKDSTVTWTAQAPAGLTVTPASGSIALPAGGKAGAPVTVTVAGDAAGGTYRIPITFSGPTGQLPGATLTVLVAKPGSIQAAVNNVGVSPDSDTSVADYDGDGFSYSADALAAAGVTRGAALTMDGLTMTWPSGATGDPDNVTAAGQTINLPDAVAGASTLELLGSSTNGDTSGTLTITYADGSTQTATIGFSDWTLGGGSMSPSFGNKIAVSTPYRNMVSGGNQRITTDLFATAPITLAAGKTVASITLPDSTTGSGALHVFSVATGTPAA